ncbi:MAG TPA: hypothetical protein ENJ77_01530 [Candidatus Moranbacteria bacterium]|nr:hypothetical protein [Candidatus Moranbacteria bacterium]
MKEYELFYLIGEKNKGNFRKIDREVRKIVSDFGGKWQEKQVTFERRLAYEIDHQRRGLYVAGRFLLPDKDERDELGEKAIENPVARISEQLSLHKGVLRFIIVDAADLPPLMTKEEKEAAAIARKQKEEISRAGKTDEQGIDDRLKEVLNVD